MTSYGLLCTEFYDLDKPQAPPDALDFYADQAAQAGGRVLEPMCGSGRFLVPMVRAGLAVDGTDASAAMIDACRRRLAAEGLQADLYAQDMAALALPGPYRLAFIPSGSLGLLGDDATLQAALAGLRAHLAPGAPLLAEFSEPDALGAQAGPTDFAPRSVVCPDGAVITYTGCAHPADAQGRTRIEGRYVKSMHGTVQATEDETLTLRGHPRERLAAMLRAAGFATVAVCTADELPFLRDSGGLLLDAR